MPRDVGQPSDEVGVGQYYRAVQPTTLPTTLVQTTYTVCELIRKEIINLQQARSALLQNLYDAQNAYAQCGYVQEANQVLQGKCPIDYVQHLYEQINDIKAALASVDANLVEAKALSSKHKCKYSGLY